MPDLEIQYSKQGYKPQTFQHVKIGGIFMFENYNANEKKLFMKISKIKYMQIGGPPIHNECHLDISVIVIHKISVVIP